VEGGGLARWYQSLRKILKEKTVPLKRFAKARAVIVAEDLHHSEREE
jgi:hypothetical protein